MSVITNWTFCSFAIQSELLALRRNHLEISHQLETANEEIRALSLRLQENVSKIEKKWLKSEARMVRSIKMDFYWIRKRTLHRLMELLIELWKSIFRRQIKPPAYSSMLITQKMIRKKNSQLPQEIVLCHSVYHCSLSLNILPKTFYLSKNLVGWQRFISRHYSFYILYWWLVFCVKNPADWAFFHLPTLPRFDAICWTEMSSLYWYSKTNRTSSTSLPFSDTSLAIKHKNTICYLSSKYQPNFISI